MRNEAERKRAERERRKKARVWVRKKGHTDGNGKKLGGYWCASEVDPCFHGTWNIYNNWYCRCPHCCRANADHVAEQKVKANANNI